LKKRTFKMASDKPRRRTTRKSTKTG